MDLLVFGYTRGASSLPLDTSLPRYVAYIPARSVWRKVDHVCLYHLNLAVIRAVGDQDTSQVGYLDVVESHWRWSLYAYTGRAALLAYALEEV